MGSLTSTVAGFDDRHRTLPRIRIEFDANSAGLLRLIVAPQGGGTYWGFT
jgi:hypothetical protein